MATGARIWALTSPPAGTQRFAVRITETRRDTTGVAVDPPRSLCLRGDKKQTLRTVAARDDEAASVCEHPRDCFAESARSDMPPFLTC